MEISWKPFDADDWRNYPGAEGEPEIATLHLPLEGVVMECDVIVDNNGINLDYWDKRDDTIHDFQFEIVAGTGKELAKHLLTLINLDNQDVTIENLMALGFIYNKV